MTNQPGVSDRDYYDGEKPNYVACKVCSKRILGNANKCVHCSSFQRGYRRYINFSSTILAVLVSFVSVTALLIQVISNLESKNSDLVFSLQKVEKDKITILASNRGTRPATIFGGELIFPVSKKPTRSFPTTTTLIIVNNRFVRNHETEDIILIEPGKTVLTYLYLNGCTLFFRNGADGRADFVSRILKDNGNLKAYDGEFEVKIGASDFLGNDNSKIFKVAEAVDLLGFAGFVNILTQSELKERCTFNDPKLNND